MTSQARTAEKNAILFLLAQAAQTASGSVADQAVELRAGLSKHYDEEEAQAEKESTSRFGGFPDHKSEDLKTAENLAKKPDPGLGGSHSGPPPTGPTATVEKKP
jgi:hypothetical protein